MLTSLPEDPLGCKHFETLICGDSAFRQSNDLIALVSLHHGSNPFTKDKTDRLNLVSHRSVKPGVSAFDSVQVNGKMEKADDGAIHRHRLKNFNQRSNKAWKVMLPKTSDRSVFHDECHSWHASPA
jgi:hypothetical protein